MDTYIIIQSLDFFHTTCSAFLTMLCRRCLDSDSSEAPRRRSFLSLEASGVSTPGSPCAGFSCRVPADVVGDVGDVANGVADGAVVEPAAGVSGVAAATSLTCCCLSCSTSDCTHKKHAHVARGRREYLPGRLRPYQTTSAGGTLGLPIKKRQRLRGHMTLKLSDPFETPSFAPAPPSVSSLLR